MGYPAKADVILTSTQCKIKGTFEITMEWIVLLCYHAMWLRHKNPRVCTCVIMNNKKTPHIASSDRKIDIILVIYVLGNVMETFHWLEDKIFLQTLA